MITQHFADLVQKAQNLYNDGPFVTVRDLEERISHLESEAVVASQGFAHLLEHNKILVAALEAVKSKTSGMIEKLISPENQVPVKMNGNNCYQEGQADSWFASAGGRCITSEEPTGTAEGTDWIEFKDASPFIDNHLEILAALVDHGLVDSLKKSLAGDVQEAVTLSATLAMITVIVTDHYKNR